MPPLDMVTCGSSVERSSVRSSSRNSLGSACEDAGTSPPRANVNEKNQHQEAADEAGERRRSRALKLRQSRTRNAARAQVYTSAEESEEEVREAAFVGSCAVSRRFVVAYVCVRVAPAFGNFDF